MFNKPTPPRVLLTGASGGMGTAMAKALREQGAHVLGISRRPDHTHAPDITWVQADLTHKDGVRDVARAAEAWGANVVVHASGVPAFGPAITGTSIQVGDVIQANLWAPIVLTQTLLPHLMSLPEGRIVFVSSALGRIGLPGYTLYGASKAGLHHYAEALRRELGHTTVKVQTLVPRATQTPFNSPEAQRFASATGSHSDPPERVAQALLDLLKGTAAERCVGWPEAAFVRLNGAIGPWLDGGFRRHRDALHPMTLKGHTP